MTVRLPRWIRRFFRRKMNPMGEEAAWKMKDKLALGYMIIAWHGLAFVLYQVYKGNKHWPVTLGVRTEDEENTRPSVQWAKTLGIKNASVVRVSGLTMSHADQISNDGEEVTIISAAKLREAVQKRKPAELEELELT